MDWMTLHKATIDYRIWHVTSSNLLHSTFVMMALYHLNLLRLTLPWKYKTPISFDWQVFSWHLLDPPLENSGIGSILLYENCCVPWWTSLYFLMWRSGVDTKLISVDENHDVVEVEGLKELINMIHPSVFLRMLFLVYEEEIGKNKVAYRLS